MKRLWIAAILLACIACSKAEEPVSQVDGAPICTEASCPLKPVAEIADVIAEENWKFVLTGSDWTPVVDAPEGITVAFQNQTNRGALLFSKEPTNQSFKDWVVNDMTTAYQSGAHIVSAKQVDINNNKFVCVQAALEGATIWTWLTAKDGFGYALNCGGVLDTDAVNPMDAVCQRVAGTLQIQ